MQYHNNLTHKFHLGMEKWDKLPIILLFHSNLLLLFCSYLQVFADIKGFPTHLGNSNSPNNQNVANAQVMNGTN